MLTHLSIRNYVLIKELDIDWQSGFSVITGETGAGKSILLGAIGLLTGQRADSKSILPGAAKCTIEGTFRQQGHEIQDFCAQRELDCEDGECIVRREVTASGKSRGFVNDTPVTVADLRALAHLLVDIHSQHQNLLLGQEDFQLNVLDTVARDSALAGEYRTCFLAYRDTRHRLDEARQRVKEAKAEEDFLAFQLGQIEELHLQPQEDTALQEEQQALTHAQEIRTALYQSAQGLGGGEDASVLDGLKGVAQTLRGAAHLYPPLAPYMERMQSAIIELQDIEADLSGMADSLESDPQRLDEVTQRLDSIYTLEQKHGVQGSDALLDTAQALSERLAAISHDEEQVTRLEAQAREALDKATRLAATLTRQRKAAAREVESHIRATLSLLEMPDTQFDIQMTATPSLTERGADQVTFLFSANKNMPPRPIAEAASGGETARVMLALKALMGMRTAMPTIIFDEIDTGVSGRVADSMARLMKQMSAAQGQQVIAITHLPQIAAQGGTHYYVYKDNTDTLTVSHMRVLTDEERVTEVAHMLSGTSLSQAAIDNARQLLGK